MVADGVFRANLLHALEVVRIDLRRLRARRGDIPVLTRYFIVSAKQEFKLSPKYFSPEALKLVAQHDPSGNVRELKNVCCRLAVIAQATKSFHPVWIKTDAHRRARVDTGR